MAIPQRQQKLDMEEQAAWTLSPEQMLFMLQHHNAIEAAFSRDDMEFLRELSAREAFVSVFGEMGIDEAYDRYEISHV